MAVGDFNGDSFPDLAVANIRSNGVSMLLNDGSWPAGLGRAGGRSSQPLFPEPLTRAAVLQPLRGEGPRFAASAFLAVAPPPVNRPVLASPAPLALPGADPPRPAILPVLVAEGMRSAFSVPRAGPRARGAPGEALDPVFAELAANGMWDDRTADGMLDGVFLPVEAIHG